MAWIAGMACKKGEKPVTISLRINNQLPLSLIVWRNGQRVAILKPHEQQQLTPAAGETWTVLDPESAIRFRSQQFAAAAEVSWTFGMNDLALDRFYPVSPARFINRTDYTVDLYCVETKGREARFSTLEPGEQTEHPLPDRQTVVARALVSGELVAAHIHRGPTTPDDYIREAKEFDALVPTTIPMVERAKILAPLGNVRTLRLVEITDDYREARHRQQQQSFGSRPEFGALRLVDGPKEAEPPESIQYIKKSTHKCGLEKQFNTRKDVTPERIRISGADLIWDRGEDKYGLMSLQGPGRLATRAVEIFADRVVIRSPLRFPRSDVTIYARELVFERSGSIDTSPQPHLAPARAKQREVIGGYDYPALRKGEKARKAADGLHGEKAGDIHLYVRTIIEDRPAVRFICNGTDGQQAEEGHAEAYRPPASGEFAKDYPQKVGQPDCLPITADNIKKFMTDHFTDSNPANWRWPGEADAPERAKLSDDPQTSDALRKGQVVFVKLIAQDDRIAVANCSRGFLPNGTFSSYVGTDFVSTLENDARLRDLGDDVVPTKPVEAYPYMVQDRPGNGADAYRPGRPGRGGNGGVVTSHTGRVSLAGKCDVRPGKGKTIGKAIGGKAGQPLPAYWLTMKIVYRSAIPSTTAPLARLIPVSARAGADAEGWTSEDGLPGEVKERDDGPLAWMHPDQPLALAAVVACARATFRNEQREQARRLLEPYQAIFIREQRAGRALPATVAAFAAEISTMLSNMASNLDYYGHPAGWLPRLNLNTCYQLWRGEREYASSLLYFTSTIESQWSKQAERRDALMQISTAVRKEIKLTSGGLPAAYERLGKARTELAAVSKEVDTIAEKIRYLQRSVEQSAGQKIMEQRIYSAFCKISGSLLEAIPVGQPYLGLAGKTLDVAGDFDWTEEDPLQQVSKGLDALGKTVENFAIDSQDEIIDRSGQKIRKKIAEAENSIDTLESSISGYQDQVDQEWVASPERAEEQQRLSSQLKQIEAKIAAARKKEEQEALLRMQETVIERLRAVESIRLDEARDKLLATIEEQEEDDKDEEARRRRELLERVEALQTRKGQFSKNLKTYEADLERREKAGRQLVNSLQKVGAGISGIGEVITKLSAPYDEAKVDRIINELIMGSALRSEYLGLTAELKKANQRKAVAIQTLNACSKAIADASAQISKNFSELIGLSDQTQMLDDALDAGALQYIQGMRQRAEDRLRWYQYNFAKAYEYEYLTPVPPKFLSLDDWIGRLVDCKRKLDNLKTDEPVELEPEDIERVEDLVVKDHLKKMAEVLVKERGKTVRVPRGVTLTPKDHPAFFSTLLRDGKVTFTLPELGAVMFTEAHARIVGFDITEFRIEPADNNLSFEIEVWHSGISVIRGVDHDTDCYYFQAGKGEAISWGFSYDGTNEKSLIMPDEEFGQAHTQLFDGEAIDYEEYYPSAFGDLTMVIVGKDLRSQESILKDIEAIKLIKLELGIAKVRTRV
ncbi:hypothetical protein [Ferrovibrio sp.]|uniref:hypothetical protein n=1 Tax=Ferrovibrio sp. TaxID=1917215 RepID=UPI00311DFB16